MVAYVRRAKKTGGAIPQWMGGKMPLSSQLADAVRGKLLEAANNIFRGREMKAARPVLEIQGRWSRIPTPRQLLIERTAMRDGTHHFIFPFAGRLVHEGLAALVAHRIAQTSPSTLSVTVNDYGFGLLGIAPILFLRDEWKKILSPDNLVKDLIECINSTELAKRQFREIARVAGLVFQGYPGQPKTVRQLQASSGLFYDVFARYDPQNLLLHQARREVLERQLEVKRMQKVLEQIAGLELELVETERLTPLSFPLWAAFVQASVSTEKWIDRIVRMAEQLEAAAQKEVCA
jgi:ATP-dependent Lhr-like helicase